MTVCTVTASPSGDVTRVVLTGEIDLANRDTVANALCAYATDPTAGGIDVDLSGVTFIDAAGFAALATGQRHARACGKTMRIGGARGRVAAVLDIIGGSLGPADSGVPEPTDQHPDYQPAPAAAAKGRR